MDDFFNPARNNNERYSNSLLNEIKRTNELLKQIAQLLQPKVSEQTNQPQKRQYQRRKQA